MPIIEISGILVDFPFEPYPSQVKYMKSVIQSLENGQNGMLQSPTGMILNKLQKKENSFDL